MRPASRRCRRCIQEMYTGDLYKVGSGQTSKSVICRMTSWYMKRSSSARSGVLRLGTS